MKWLLIITLLVLSSGLLVLTQQVSDSEESRPVESTATSPDVTPQIIKIPPKDIPAVTLVIAAPSRWRQGEDVLITVNVLDPATQSVSMYLSGLRTPVGGRSHGRLVKTISKPAAPRVDEDGKMLCNIRYHVPFLDGIKFQLVAKAFGTDGKVIAKSQIPVTVVPAAVPKDMKDGVVVSKSLQRLYGVKDGSIIDAYVVSTGRKHADGGGPTPSMVSRICSKIVVAHSKRYDVDMRYWNAITSDGRYGIHATCRNLYRKLGKADSHGCVRLHLSDARQVYHTYPIGTAVYIVQ